MSSQHRAFLAKLLVAKRGPPVLDPEQPAFATDLVIDRNAALDEEINSTQRIRFAIEGVTELLQLVPHPCTQNVANELVPAPKGILQRTDRDPRGIGNVGEPQAVETPLDGNRSRCVQQLPPVVRLGAALAPRGLHPTTIRISIRKVEGKPMSHPARSLSLWHDTLPEGDLETSRAPLAGSADYDVAIVGGGFTGLWTAYYLARIDPTLRIVVLEKEFAGFGASGRNGGWASGLLPMSLAKIARESSRAQAIALQTAANDTVDEVGKVAAAERIDAHYEKGGYLRVATSPTQLERLRADVADARAWGQTDDDLVLLDRDETKQRINAESVFGGVFTPHCAAIHPARLVRGLAVAAERLGVTICEQTAVTSIEPGCAYTDRGDVRAEVVVRALEGYTASLPQYRRDLLPVYSLMIATEPLPDHIWSELGWRDRETFNDDRRFLIYAQRTADGRIAFGGRGAPITWDRGSTPHSNTRGASTKNCAGRWFGCSRRWLMWPLLIAGVECWQFLVTGTRPSTTTAPPASRRRAATAVME